LIKIGGLLPWSTSSVRKTRASKVYRWTIVLSHIYLLVTSFVNFSQTETLNTSLKVLWRFFVLLTFALNYLFVFQLGVKIKETFSIPEKYLCYKFRITKDTHEKIKKNCIQYGICLLIIIIAMISAVIRVLNIETYVTENNAPSKFYITSLRTIYPNVNLISNLIHSFANVQVLTVFFALNILVLYYFTIIHSYYQKTIQLFEGVRDYSIRRFSRQNYIDLETHVKYCVKHHQYVVG
jgi:hypothetical protein